jgi:hypothetical protein
MRPQYGFFVNLIGIARGVECQGKVNADSRLPGAMLGAGIGGLPVSPANLLVVWIAAYEATSVYRPQK